MNSTVTVAPGTVAAPDTGSADTGTSSILWKAFAILDAFKADRSPLSLSAISRRSGVPKSTVHRVLGMLLDLGAVERRGERYGIGPTMYSLGTRSPETELHDAARPHLQALAARTGQLVQFGVLRGRDILYLDKIGTRSMLTPIGVGDRLAAHMTALGKAILSHSDDDTVGDVLSGPLARATDATLADPALLSAELATTRDRRFAVDREEVRRGLRCVAVPVLDRDRPVAAVSIAYGASGGSGHVFAGALHDTAARIARSLRPSGAIVGR